MILNADWQPAEMRGRAFLSFLRPQLKTGPFMAPESNPQQGDTLHRGG